MVRVSARPEGRGRSLNSVKGGADAAAGSDEVPPGAATTGLRNEAADVRAERESEPSLAVVGECASYSASTAQRPRSVLQ